VPFLSISGKEVAALKDQGQVSMALDLNSSKNSGKGQLVLLDSAFQRADLGILEQARRRSSQSIEVHGTMLLPLALTHLLSYCSYFHLKCIGMLFVLGSLLITGKFRLPSIGLPSQPFVLIHSY
jgi:hypothetical protein